MSKVPYYVSDELGAICVQLGISGYELLGGHYAFTASAWQSAVNQIQNKIDELLYGDEDLSNDPIAYGYQGVLEAGYTLLFWSTEGKFWY